MKARWLGVCICGLLLVGPALGSYRDKHGNEGTITFLGTTIHSGGHDIDYTVGYGVTDSDGTKSGEYAITSQMIPGRGATDDFALSILVTDDATMNGAELIFRNHPDTAPAMPILRLLDCSTSPCTEVKTYDDPRWGCWVIQDSADVANYPIELLDARVILKLLEPAMLAMLPNGTDGTGNWAEIMENHRTNFNEAKFRMDTEHLGDTQSDLLTTRIIAEIDAHRGSLDACASDADCTTPGETCAVLAGTCNSPEDWLVRHFDPACGFADQVPPCVGIQHGALTFFTEHKDLIEDMSTTLFTNHLDDWPLDHTFPFGRIPVFLVDPHDDAGPDSGGGADPFHQLPLHWERVITGQGPLGQEGCWHDWPPDAYSPILDNGDATADPGEGTTHIGQFECATEVTANGFVDRPCTEPTDYAAGMDAAVEGSWHNPIHGVIGGSFGPPATTAGTMVFWVFHTYASTVALSNWRQAQRRDMGEPNQTPSCDANGPYVAECTGATTDVSLDGSASSDPDGDSLDYLWTTDCPGASFDDDTSATPTLTVDSVAPCPLDCTVTLTVTDPGGASAECDTDVTVEDTSNPTITVVVEPDVLWPPNHKLWDIEAIITVDDDCDADPDVVLEPIVVNEPDNSNGDGNTANDVQDADFGTDDRHFRLRAERRGPGEGRVYEITYSVTDACGNSATAMAEVRVPHDQSGAAFGWSGFTADGLALDPGTTEYGIVIPSTDFVDASGIDTSRIYVGNYAGVQKPLRHELVDLRQDGRPDLLVVFDALETRIVRSSSNRSVGLHYRTADGTDYAVEDIFRLGPPLGTWQPAVLEAAAEEDTEATSSFSAR